MAAQARLSPLALLLCAIFFFSANVFAASAVLGVDLGTEYIKAALVKPGIPLEIVLTKDSRRKELSAVTFKPSQNAPKSGTYPERLYGSDAMALAPRFSGDVYPNLKVLLGLPVSDPVVKEYAARHPGLQLEAHKVKGTAAFKSKAAFAPEEEAWLVEELLAMQLQSVQKNAELLAGPGTTIRSAVVSVPPFYTIEEKRAVELAAELAGLRVLSLITEGLAVGLHYSTSRQFPNINEGAKPEIHMVFDMGAGSTTTTIMKFQSRTVKDVGKFNKTVQEVQVLGSGWDRTLGGDALNSLIVDDMVAKFVESPAAKKIGVTEEKVKAHGRAIAKLTKEAERLRHVLSANSNTQASFEGLYEDVDFKYKILRTDFEKMAEKHADRVGATVRNALEMAGLNQADLDSVILHGGATRTPFVQKQLESLFGGEDKLRTNVNSDEAAVFGAAFRAAEISPSFRVKEIRVSDGAAYPAGIKWTDHKDKLRHQRLWTPTSHLGAQPKEITFNNKNDFSIEFYQQVPSLEGTSPDLEERPTKRLTTKNLTATVAMLGEKYGCDTSTASFKVAARLASEDGEVEITKAAVECEVEETEKEGFVDGVKNLFGFGKKDQEPLKEGETSSSDEQTLVDSSSATTASSTTTSSSESTSTTGSSDQPASSAEVKEQVLKKKLVTIPVDYDLENTGTIQLSKTELATLKDRLKSFTASDKSRQQREEALNQLEAFTYKVRDLLDSESFVAVSTADERSDLEKRSSEASEWLYGDGADALRDDFRRRLQELQDIVVPIQNRIEENSKRPELIQGLKDTLKQTGDFVKSIRDKVAEYESQKARQSSSSSSSSTPTTTPTAAASKDGFDGLEDDDAASGAGQAPDQDDKEAGPLPPLYTLEDIKESEELYQTSSAWLEEKIAEQAKLGPTDNAVLTIKELAARRAKLEKISMDLAMKAVRNFEGKNKKKAKSSKSKKSKSSKTGEPTAGHTIKIGEDGQVPTTEELEEILRQYKQEQDRAKDTKAEKSEGEKDPKHDEL